MKCPMCEGEVKKGKDVIKEDKIDYEYYRCNKCGEEFLNMKQLEKVAKKYRELRNAKEITFAKWGNSIAVRIPKEFVNDLKIESGKQGVLLKDKDGLRIVVEES